MRATLLVFLLAGACAPTGVLLRRAPVEGVAYQVSAHMRQVTHTGEVFESLAESSARVESFDEETGIAVYVETVESVMAGREGEMEPAVPGVGEVRRAMVDVRGIGYEPCEVAPGDPDCEDQRRVFGGALPWPRVFTGPIHLPEEPIRPGREWTVPVVAGGTTPIGNIDPEPLECRMHGIEATGDGELVHVSCTSSAVLRIKTMTYEMELELVQRLDLGDAFAGVMEVRARKRLSDHGHDLGEETEVTTITITRRTPD